MLLVDLLLVAAATSGALVVRDNFEMSTARIAVFAPYFLVTLGVFATLALAGGVNRSIWRLSTARDQLRLMSVIALTVLLSLAVSFGVNRLDGIARGLPVIQALMMAAALMGGRFFARERHLVREGQRSAAEPAREAQAIAAADEVLLVVGINRIADLYLQSLHEFGKHVAVAGLLGRKPQQTGRTVQGVRILGTPEDAEAVVRELEVRGIIVQRIVVTLPFEHLPKTAQEALLRLESTSTITLEFVADWVRRPAGGSTADVMMQSDGGVEKTGSDRFAFTAMEIKSITGRPYWRAKRWVDVIGASLVLALLAPVQLAVALLVAYDLGFPVVFWQQRPGRAGKPFRLYKFRTMGASHDATGQRRSDSKRCSRIGQFLRRTRLDELPQLYNILRGEMSFVGPRPLLPVDQPNGRAARLSVRPGLTGWAQIMGGRIVSAEDKLALDLWYVRNASLLLDLRILLGTVSMLIGGDHVDIASLDSAWSELASVQETPAAMPASYPPL